MLITSKNWRAWTAGSLKYLISCRSCAVGLEAGSLLRDETEFECALSICIHSPPWTYLINRDVASWSGIGIRGSILWTPSSNYRGERNRNDIEWGSFTSSFENNQLVVAFTNSSCFKYAEVELFDWMSGRPWLKMAQITSPRENISLKMQQDDCSWFSGAGIQEQVLSRNFILFLLLELTHKVQIGLHHLGIPTGPRGTRNRLAGIGLVHVLYNDE